MRTAPTKIGSVERLLVNELEAVEARLREVVRSREPRITEIAEYLIEAGGKRIRPLVTIASFRACGGEDVTDAVDVAVALELIHSASLLHDDIIDGSDVRRGRASPYRRFGTADTLVVGDFLFARAFDLCGRFDAEIISWATGACVLLTEGEVLQASFRRNPEIRLEDYREIIHRKTASLFEQGSRVAAHLAGAPRSVVERFAAVGHAIGMAFQIVDDLLDVAGDTGETGKPIGIDLRDGNPSLPVVLALSEGDLEVRRIWTRSESTAAEMEACRRRLATPTRLERMKDEALTYTRAAVSGLETLPTSPYRERLIELVWDLAGRLG